MQKIKNHIENQLSKIKNLKLSTPTAIIIGSIIISISIIISQDSSKTNNVSAMAFLKPFGGKSLSTDKYIDGKNDKIFLVEYSDTECPYCIQFSSTFEQARKDYGDKIGIIYRNYAFHTNAPKEAEAINCAGDIGGKNSYFAYIKALFDYKLNNQVVTLPLTGKEDLAKKIGLDLTKFGECLSSGKFTQEISSGIDDGATAEVTGTPTSFVIIKDGETYRVVSKIDGARPYSYVKQAIDQALKLLD